MDTDIKSTLRASCRALLRPVASVGLKCGIHEPSPPLPRGVRPNRHTFKRFRRIGLHYHEHGCYCYVPSGEIDRWIEEHPGEHEAFKRRVGEYCA